jgi:hypothetical protein
MTGRVTTTVAGLRALLDRFAAIGCDEVHLIPTSSDLSQVERIADAL